MGAGSTVVGVLLAAGFGRRFGADKRFHPLSDGTPMAVAAARRLRVACAYSVAVVRADDADLAALLQETGCAVVHSAAAAQGMGHSLAAGVAATAGAGGWLVALADMPYIAPASYRAVLAALAAGAPIARPRHRGAPGHPVGFAREWQPHLAALGGDSGARELVRAAGERCVAVEVDDAGVLCDVDIPDGGAGRRVT